MDKDLIKIRKVKSEDARDWFVFGFKIWRDAYKNIFPEEVFVDRESKLEEKVKGYEDIINYIMYEMNLEIGNVTSVFSIKVFVDKPIYKHLRKLWKKPRKSRKELGL